MVTTEEEADELKNKKLRTDKYGNLIPISKADYDALKVSIATDGLHYPTIINQSGDVLDGHHRLQACQELRIEPRFETKYFDNELEEEKFVRIINVNRRHMNEFQKVRQALALEPIEAELARQRQISAGKTQTPLSPYEPKGRVKEIVSRAVGLTPTTYYRGKIIEEKGSEEVKKRLEESRSEITTEYNKIMRAQKRVKAREEAEAFAKELALPEKVMLLNKDSTKLEELTEIPDSSVSIVITDPPYAGESLSLFDRLAEFALRKLKEDGSLLFYFGQPHLPEITSLLAKYEDLGLFYQWPVAVIHTGSHQARYQPLGVEIGWKPMLWYKKKKKGSKRYDSHKPAWQPDLSDVIYSSPPDKLAHDWAQSPVEAEYLISKLTINEHSLVVDPFLGSGAFGIAAAKLGRYFIGVEINRETYENARNYIIKETAVAVTATAAPLEETGATKSKMLAPPPSPPPPYELLSIKYN